MGALISKFSKIAIDDYTNNGRPGGSELDVVFTMNLCKANFNI